MTLLLSSTVSLCDEIFDHFLLFDETLRHKSFAIALSVKYSKIPQSFSSNVKYRFVFSLHIESRMWAGFFGGLNPGILVEWHIFFDFQQFADSFPGQVVVPCTVQGEDSNAVSGPGTGEQDSYWSTQHSEPFYLPSRQIATDVLNMTDDTACLKYVYR